jgi:Ran GTPase-activating protein (RanGAP) involved in mRNA processing and transport
LLSAFSKFGSSLKTLKLSRVALGARGINKLAETLLSEAGFVNSLQCLDLSDNSTKGEDITVSEGSSSVDCYV